ncbi:MAG: nuclear transport factor 2 family protein [Asgard group archaeon]|nr:nuclear transport factor 2 family protein [Asgard group archaeon]
MQADFYISYNLFSLPIGGYYLRNPEYENILKTIDTFVEGIRVMDYDLISEAFFEHGLSCGSIKGKLNYVYRDHWKEMREEMIAKGEELVSEKANYSIRSMNIVGNAASVIMDLTFGTKDKIQERYVEFFHLLKIDDKWLIVNKIFPTNPEFRFIEK